MRIILTLVLVGMLSASLAQKKDEREQRIREAEVPAEILNILKPFTKDLKVRYISERDGDRSSYEAKFRSKNRTFSVEFDTLGVLEDVEIGIKLKALKKEIRDNINSYLRKSSDSYKILKCQKQYAHVSGDSAETLRHAINNESHAPINYELEVDMQMGKVLESNEMLFDSEGKFLSKRLIVNRATDNLLY